MRIDAIWFGRTQGQESQFINLGGSKLFSFKFKSLKLSINCLENQFFIKDFFHPNISNISAFVGKNGSGKTNMISNLAYILTLNISFSWDYAVIIVADENGKTKIISKQKENHQFGHEDISFPSIEIEFTEDHQVLANQELVCFYYSRSIDNPYWNFEIEESEYFQDLSLAKLISEDASSVPDQKNPISAYKYVSSIGLMRFLNEVNQDQFLENFGVKFYNFSVEFYRPSFNDTRSKLKDKDGQFCDHFNSLVPNSIDQTDKESMICLIVLEFYFIMVSQRTRKSRTKISLSDIGHLSLLKGVERFLNERELSTEGHWETDNSAIYTLELLNKLIAIEPEAVTWRPYKANSWPLARVISFNSFQELSKIYYEISVSESSIGKYPPQIFSFTVPHISSGQEAALNFFSTIYSRCIQQKPGSSLILFLDELEVHFHPEWKKKLIKEFLIRLADLLSPKLNLQFIFATNDVLPLSDLPKTNVATFLKKDGNEYTCDSSNSNIHSFGANITQLYENSFFIEGGLIGDFAKEKINEVFRMLKEKKDSNDKVIPLSEDEEIKCKKIIQIIDDPMLQEKLATMLAEKTDDKNFKNEIIRKQIKALEAKLK